MSQHFSVEQVERYLQRAMTREELLAADDHLAECSDCRARLLRLGRPEAAVAALRDDLSREAGQREAHLDYEQLEAYVDGAMTEVDREIVDSHVYVCRPCKEELRDLFAFRETLSRAPALEPLAAESPAPSFTERLLRPVRLAFGHTSFQLAGAFGALAIVALAVMLWVIFRSQETAQPGQVARLEPTPVTVETPATTVTTPTPSQGQGVEQGSATNGDTQEVKPPATVSNGNRPQRVEPVPRQGQSSDVMVALNDAGRNVTLDAEGRLAGLGNLSPSEEQAIRSALATGRAQTPQELAGLRGRTAALMGDTPAAQQQEVSFQLLSPVGIVTRADAPAFRWQAVAGASSYRVDVFDSGFNKVMTSGQIPATQWAAPRPLPRGKTYSWQVTATTASGEMSSPVAPQPEARFRVLDSAQAESLRRAEQSYAGSHLALGVLYARAGLLDEAEREFRALLAANPGSQVARKLLQNVEAQKKGR